MKMFLSSFFREVADKFAEFAGGSISGASVAFIPTASLTEEDTTYVEDGKHALEALGLIVDPLAISTARYDDIERKLRDSDYIYVAGGNTFFLLQQLKRTGADRLLVEQIRDGKCYIGESAGSIILAPDIGYIEKMDDPRLAPGLTSFDALNVIDFYPLPHYRSYPFYEEAEAIYAAFNGKIRLMPFGNTEAITVDENRVVIRH